MRARGTRSDSRWPRPDARGHIDLSLPAFIAGVGLTGAVGVLLPATEGGTLPLALAWSSGVLSLLLFVVAFAVNFATQFGPSGPFHKRSSPVGVGIWPIAACAFCVWKLWGQDFPALQLFFGVEGLAGVVWVAIAPALVRRAKKQAR